MNSCELKSYKLQVLLRVLVLSSSRIFLVSIFFILDSCNISQSRYFNEYKNDTVVGEFHSYKFYMLKSCTNIINSNNSIYFNFLLFFSYSKLLLKEFSYVLNTLIDIIMYPGRK